MVQLHQPIEQLSQFRAMPNFYTFRPADATENIECWKVALNMNAPTAFVTSRQGLKNLKGMKVIGDVSNGGYLVSSKENPKVTFMASGSEVSLCLEAAKLLEAEGIFANVVSVPCFDILCEQTKEYINQIILPQTKVIAVEAATATEYYKFADEVIGMTTFGESGPANELFEKFGFTASKIAEKTKSFFN